MIFFKFSAEIKYLSINIAFGLIKDKNIWSFNNFS